MSKVVFLSYAGDHRTWVENFTDDDVFRKIVGHDVKLGDYADTVNVGPIKKWLNEQVEGAAAVVAFLSKEYTTGEFTLAEFWRSLDQLRQRRLIFVPVMMDTSAIGWWKLQQQKGRLQELLADPGDSYAYSDFTHRGQRLDIVSNGRFNDGPARRIGEIARLIRDRLNEVADPTPDDGPGHDDPIDDPIDQPPTSRPVVILGHASAPMPTEVAAASTALKQHLVQSHIEVSTFQDQWAVQASIHGQGAIELIDKDAIFVQPLGPMDAGEAGQNPQRERNRLKRLIQRDTPHAEKLEQSRIILWLPRGLPDDDFAACKDAPPTFLSSQTTEELAERLTREAGPRPVVPVIMLEDLSENPKLRRVLTEEFRKIVEQEVRPPLDTYDFAVTAASKMLEQQIAQVPGDRVILAIHDLNVRQARRLEDARKYLDDKLGAFSERVKIAQQLAGREDLKLFWSALVLRNFKFLPFVRHPSPQFEDWHLLGFEEPPNQQCRAEPTYSRMFRNYLHDWVQS